MHVSARTYCLVYLLSACVLTHPVSHPPVHYLPTPGKLAPIVSWPPPLYSPFPSLRKSAPLYRPSCPLIKQSFCLSGKLRSPTVLLYYCTLCTPRGRCNGSWSFFLCSHNNRFHFNLSFKYGNHNCIPFVFFCLFLGCQSKSTLSQFA